MNREKIGLMGGSFNPIHRMHLEMAQAARKEFKLDRLIFLPSGNPPHKREGLESAEDRFEMTRLAVMNLPNCEVSRTEIDREGVIYTVDTLSLLKKQYPGAELYYIIGEDTMVDLPNWRNPDEVFKLCRFLVCARTTGNPADQPCVKSLRKRGAKLDFISRKPVPVSSTQVREMLKAGETPPDVPPQVLEYIRITGLYGLSPVPAEGRAYYEKLKLLLTSKRLLHSLMVCEYARQLARLYNADMEKVTTAALLHDCAKCLPPEKMRSYAAGADPDILSNGNLLHGPAGAGMARQDFGITDETVLNAIACHTTGRAEMNTEDLIVYIADKIERSRKPYPALENLRKLADTDLKLAVMESMRSTVEYVRRNGDKPLHPQTLLSYQWLCNEVNKSTDNGKEPEHSEGFEHPGSDDPDRPDSL